MSDTAPKLVFEFTPDLPDSITAAALREVAFAPVSWVVEGLVPDGLTMLAGKPKLGKSWLMLDAAVAVASGGEVLGRCCEAADVLYAALEDNRRRLQGRLARVCGGGAWPERLTLWTEMKRLEDGGLEQLDTWIRMAERPRLIVIDVFSKVRRAKGLSEGIYDADYAAAAPLKDLADRTGVAVVIVHHLRKAGAEDDPLDAVSGSTGLTGAVDTILVLNRGSEGVTLYGRGRDIEEVESAMSFDRSACRWTLLGEASQVRISDERRAILDALAGESAPVGPNVIADVTGRAPGAVRMLLHKMARDGEVAKAGRGKYVLPDLTPHDIGDRMTSAGRGA